MFRGGSSQTAKVPVPSMSTPTSKPQNVPAGKVACNPIGNVPRSGAVATAELTKTSAAAEANALAANVRMDLIVLSLLFMGRRCASTSAAPLGPEASRYGEAGGGWPGTPRGEEAALRLRASAEPSSR